MHLTILHLSDLHFRRSGNWVTERALAIAGAALSTDPQAAAFLLIVSGDLAYSGKSYEYAESAKFLNGLVESLRNTLTRKVEVVSLFVPGNHDCDFDIRSDVRDLIIDSPPEKKAVVQVSGAVAENCVAVQAPFFDFVRERLGLPTIPIAEKFFRSVHPSLAEVSIRIDLYNTAWLSVMHERQGQLAFPVDSFSATAGANQADIAVAVFHHPYNWLEANNARRFRSLIESTSNFVLTGHEHEGSLFAKEVAPSQHVVYLEGAVLQQGENRGDSGFSVINIDTSPLRYKVTEFSWETGMYVEKETRGWAILKPNGLAAGRLFSNTEDFVKGLEDLGTGFTHPKRKSQLVRGDLFIYPELVQRSAKDGGVPKLGRIPSQNVSDTVRTSQRAVLFGADLVGKSTLAKQIYDDFRKSDEVIPLLVSGRALLATNQTELERFLKGPIEEQYGVRALTSYLQLPPNGRALIVDDFHLSKMNSHGQAAFIGLVSNMFETVLLFTNELFSLEYLTVSRLDLTQFGGFDQFEIKEFGFYLRGKLIEKWVRLGNESVISDQQLDLRSTELERTIETVLGKNLLPSNPLTILTILQAWESNKNHDVGNGSYGYLYETLIFQALSSTNLTPPEIDAVKTFLSELAYDLFSADGVTFSAEQLQRAEQSYFQEYLLRLPPNLAGRLADARIFQFREGLYRFRYPYYQYFFAANHLRNGLQFGRQPGLGTKISEMIEHVYYEPYSHVLTFYVYLTRDVEAISQILAGAKSMLSQVTPCDFSEDVSFLNDLYAKSSQPTTALIPKSAAADNKDEFRRELDNEEDARGPNGDLTVESPEKVKYSESLSDLLKLNIATKMLQILGQVLRNSPGSIRAEVKSDLASEAFLLGLRIMNAAVVMAKGNLAGFRIYFQEMLRERLALTKSSPVLESDIARRADESILKLMEAYGFAIVKRISQGVGLRELSPIYEDVLRRHGSPIAMRLIDVSIKLDCFSDPPVSDLEGIEKALRNNPYSHNVLRGLVMAFLYFREVDYRPRNRLMSRFKIAAAKGSLFVDNPNKRARGRTIGT